MNAQSIWHFVERALGVFGGISVIAVGLSGWFGKFWLRRTTDKLKLELDFEFKRRLEIFKQELRLEKAPVIHEGERR